MAHPSIGDLVHVWPHPGKTVRSHDPAVLHRYLDAEGAKLPWSQWLEDLHHAGLVHLTDPRGISLEEARALIDKHQAAANPAIDAATRAQVEAVAAVIAPTSKAKE